MKFKKLLIIAGVVLCLLALAAIKNIAVKRQASKKGNEIAVIDLTKDVSEGFVSKIIVYKGSDEKSKMTLRKDPSGKWILENRFGLSARKEAVDSLLKELSDVSGEVRSDSKLVLEDFSISDVSGVHVILKAANDKVLKHMVVGLKRPVWNMNFIRLAQDANVIAAQKDILSRLNLYDVTSKLDEDYFADLKILTFDINKVERLELKEADKKGLFLVKGSSNETASLPAWNLEPPVKGQVIDPSKVDGFLQNIANMYAQDALDPALNTYGFDDPSLDIKLFISQDNSAPIQLIFGKYLEPQKAFFLRVLPKGLVFRVPETFVQNLKKERSYFLKEKAPKR